MFATKFWELIMICILKLNKNQEWATKRDKLQVEYMYQPMPVMKGHHRIGS